MSILIPQNIGKPLTDELRKQLLVEIKQLEDLLTKSSKEWESSGSEISFSKYLKKETSFATEVLCYDHDMYFMKRTLATGIVQMGEERDEQC